MTSQEKGRPLPKFGEWDVNNPASADGFTVIFAKARDEKKATGAAGTAVPQAAQPVNGGQNESNDNAVQFYLPSYVVVKHVLVDDNPVVCRRSGFAVFEKQELFYL